MDAEATGKPILKPILIYDGDCAFCALWIAHWQRLTGDAVEYAPFQEVEGRYPQISHETFERGVQLVMPDGTIYRNAEAVFRLMQIAPTAAGRRRRWMLWAYQDIPGFAAISEFNYRTIARHRDFGYWITQLWWGKHIGPHSYILTRWLFLRGLALIYLIAFGSLAVQILGLVGSGGILPAANFLGRMAANVPEPLRYLQFPTLAWLNSSDGFLQFLCYGGMGLALLLLFDLAPAITAFLCWLFYSSLMVVGQNFLSFQWDILLLETGFLAFLFAPSYLIPRYRAMRQPSLIMTYLYRWLLFRLMFSSGAIKLLSEDPVWRDLTALDYHWWTQPIPNLIAWYMAQLPQWVGQAGVTFTFVVELGVPFLYFLPRRPRFVGALLTVALMILIMLTGNYTFFNLLTIVLCIPLLDDDLLRKWLPGRFVQRVLGHALPPHRSVVRGALITLLAAFILFTSGLRFFGLFSQNLGADLPTALTDLANATYRARIVGGYGLFANMTTARPEIVIEGSNDGQTWLPYEFYYKPTDIYEPPVFVAPHQPRLDWQLWFAALGQTYERSPWFVSFARRLLTGAPDVLALIKVNPFPDAPPRFLRATLMDYGFTDIETRDLIGAWWTRRNPRVFLLEISLESFR